MAIFSSKPNNLPWKLPWEVKEKKSEKRRGELKEREVRRWRYCSRSSIWKLKLAKLSKKRNAVGVDQQDTGIQNGHRLQLLNNSHSHSCSFWTMWVSQRRSALQNESVDSNQRVWQRSCIHLRWQFWCGMLASFQRWSGDPLFLWLWCKSL